MQISRVLSLLIWAASHRCSSGTSYVVAGSGGCDGDDRLCRSPEYSTDLQMLWSYTLTADGTFYPQDKWNVGGVPAWLVARRKPQNHGGYQLHSEGRHRLDNAYYADKEYTDCMFVMLADVSKVLSYRNTDQGFEQVGAAVDSGGFAPVHGSVSSDGRVLLVANYHGPDDTCDVDGASVAAFTINKNCSLISSDVKPHRGSSVVKSRQCTAHVHSVTTGSYMLAFAADLGQDLIFTYLIGNDGKLTELARTPVSSGSGPRHSAQHPHKNFLYVVTEMTSTLVAFRILPSGKLVQIMNTTTLPDDELSMGYGSKAAEVLVSADGLTVYTSNRAFGDGFKSSISVYRVQDDGGVQRVQQVIGPEYARGMAFAPSAKQLVVEGQRQGVLQAFNIDPSGFLAAHGTLTIGPPGAASIVVMPAAQLDAERVLYS